MSASESNNFPMMVVQQGAVIVKTSNNNDSNETVKNQMEQRDVTRLLPCTTTTSAMMVGNATAAVIPNLVDLLRRDDCPDLQLEAACCLTNIIHDGANNIAAAAITDDDDSLTLIVTGAIPQLVRLLGTSPSFHVREQVVCALGNMARDSVKCRDAILEAGVLPPLLELLDPLSTSLSSSCGEDDVALDGGDAAADLQEKQDHSYRCTSPTTSSSCRKRSIMQFYGTWALAGLCLSKPSPPDFNMIRTALPTLAKLLESNDALVLKQACTTVACLISGSMEKKQAVLAAGICPRLVALLDDHKVNISSSSSHLVQEAAVRTLAIIMSGNPSHHPYQTQMVIQHVLRCNNGSVLPRLRALLDSPVAEIRRYTCWAICNVTSGQNNEQHIQAMIHYNIIPPLIHLFVHDGDSRKQAFLTVLNTLARGTAQQVQYIVQQGCIAPIVNLLMVSDPTMIRVALVALESILRVGQEIVDMSSMATESSSSSPSSSTIAGSNCAVPIIHTHTTTNPMAVLIFQANGLEKIRQLRQLFAHDFICTQCTRILQVYFDEVEIMDIAPAA